MTINFYRNKTIIASFMEKDKGNSETSKGKEAFSGGKKRNLRKFVAKKRDEKSLEKLYKIHNNNDNIVCL